MKNNNEISKKIKSHLVYDGCDQCIKDILIISGVEKISKAMDKVMESHIKRTQKKMSKIFLWPEQKHMKVRIADLYQLKKKILKHDN